MLGFNNFPTTKKEETGMGTWFRWWWWHSGTGGRCTGSV